MTTYLIKVILCSALFMLLYKVLLQKEKMLVFNRFYLLFSLALSFVIPLLTLGASADLFPVVEPIVSDAGISAESAEILPPSTIPDNNTLPILLAAYMLVAGVLLFRLVWNLRGILRKAVGNTIVPYNRSSIVLIQEEIIPHSFLHYIFLNKEAYLKGRIGQEILVHEYAHVKQKHSFDILLLEIIRSFFWINPFFWMARKEMQLNHEFLADLSVLQTFNDVAGYQQLLLEKLGWKTPSLVTNQFNYCITKKRFIMMTKKTSLKTALCRQVTVVPVLVLSVFLFGASIAGQRTTVQPALAQNITSSTQQGISSALMKEYGLIVDKMKDAKGSIITGKLSGADQQRLEMLFIAMSKEQQAQQVVVFMPVRPPLPKQVPTNEQMALWMNASVYGLWIDDKRVSNNALNKYRNTDFAQVFVSKLAKNAVNYGKHFYQVNLMTVEAYHTYLKETRASAKKYVMGIRMVSTPKKEVEKGNNPAAIVPMPYPGFTLFGGSGNVDPC